jgi:hypothetical protein
LTVVFQKSLIACGFASSWNFKCFCTCLSNKSHFSSLLSFFYFWQGQRYLLSSNKPHKCPEPALLSQWYSHPHYVDLSDYHCVTWPLCGCPWRSASALSPTHLV